MFKSKNSVKPHDMISFNGQNISTGMVLTYLAYLAAEFNMKYFGYRYDNINGCLRFVIYSIYNPNQYMKFYFQDRVPAMIEQEIIDVYNDRKDVYKFSIKEIGNCMYVWIEEQDGNAEDFSSCDIEKYIKEHISDDKLYTRDSIIKLLTQSIRYVHTDPRTMSLGLHTKDSNLKAQIDLVKNLANRLGVNPDIIDEMLKDAYVD